MCDIFGSEVGGGHIEGLIDATGSSEFMEKSEILKPKWEILSKEFPKWFTVHEVELFCSSMIASVRCLAGLGNPPKYYTTGATFCTGIAVNGRHKPFIVCKTHGS